MARKTISVEFVKDEINATLARSADSESERRWGMMAVLEKILHESGNYSGFRYLEVDEINGAVPGINKIDTYLYPELRDVLSPEYDGDMAYRVKFEGTDRTRVRYF